MKEFNIKYEILHYDTFYERLNDLVNGNMKNKVMRCEPIGVSACGFNIEHYKIGDGPIHIVYMGGAHGNEIIGVDFVTQLMKNIAEGNGEFENFDPDTFTIDFIPCQNPEGFFTTTYALKQFFGNASSNEVEKKSKEYWSKYREDDMNVLNVNKLLRELHDKTGITNNVNTFISLFWLYFNDKEITSDLIVNYLEVNYSLSNNDLKIFISDRWNELFKGKASIPSEKHHQQFFDNITFDCIPDRDDAHRLLKSKLVKMYDEGRFPIGTLANFFPNADGVNLNDNNINYFEETKEVIANKGYLFANLRDNNISKTIPSPVGMPSKSYDEPFEYAPENQGLLNFLEQQEKLDENFAFFNCHGTGGVLYTYPVFVDDSDKAHTEGVTRDFTFYINGRIATEYTNATGKIYQDKTQEFAPYKTMGHPDRVTGVGDYLRKKYRIIIPLKFTLNKKKQ